MLKPAAQQFPLANLARIYSRQLTSRRKIQRLTSASSALYIGRYFTDPRPFYFLSGDQKLSFMDDCFAPGKKEGNKFIESDLKKQPEKSKGKDEESKEKEKAEAGKKKVDDKSKTVELRVNLCCNRCERKVREALEDVPGVELVDCDQLNRKVLVKGSVKPEVVLKKVKKLKRDAELVGKN